jgi:hypothetical protein
LLNWHVVLTAPYLFGWRLALLLAFPLEGESPKATEESTAAIPVRVTDVLLAD